MRFFMSRKLRKREVMWISGMFFFKLMEKFLRNNFVVFIFLMENKLIKF